VKNFEAKKGNKQKNVGSLNFVKVNAGLVYKRKEP